MPVKVHEDAVGLPVFMPTTDELTTVQRQGMKTAKAISYKNPPRIFIFV